MKNILSPFLMKARADATVSILYLESTMKVLSGEDLS